MRSLDRESGQARWTLDLRGGSSQEAQIHADLVVTDGSFLGVATDSVRAGSVVAVSQPRGTEVWRAGVPFGASALFRHESSLIAVSATGEIRAFAAASGDLRWSRPRAGRPFQGELLPAMLDRGRLYVGNERKLEAIDPRDGKILWSRDELGVRGLAVEGDDLAVVMADGVRLFDSCDGTLRASAALRDAWCAPLLIGENVVVQVVSDTVAALVIYDRKTLEKRGSVAMPAALSVPRIVGRAGIVFAGLADGRVIGVTVPGGEISEVTNLDGRVRSIELDGEGTMFVGTSSGIFARIDRRPQ